MPTPLITSPRYSKFIQERDQVLGLILNKYLNQLDRVVDVLIKRCQEVASHISTQSQHHPLASQNRKLFENRIAPWFEMAVYTTVESVENLRKTSYVLSYIGQCEAIGRALNKSTRYHLDHHTIHSILKEPMTHGGTLHARMDLGYARLMHKVVEAFHSSQVLESPLDETLDRIKRAFPTPEKRKRISKLIAPMKERGTKPPLPSGDAGENGLSFGVIDPEEWERIVDDYSLDQLPIDRSPVNKMFFGNTPNEEDDQFVYGWQVESEVVDDFVNRVRNGEDDAANANGIDDFSWIAIVSDKTCESCIWRDGLTSTEIEKQLDKEHSDDDITVTSSPAHFHCYCRMSPCSDDMPKETPPDFGSFDDWLDSKAQEAA